MFRIAESRADVLAIVEAMKGRHDPGPMDRLGGWMLAFFFVFGGAALVLELGADIRSFPLWLLALLCCFPICAAAVLLEYNSSYIVDDVGFHRYSRFAPWSWSVELNETRAIDLDLFSSPPKLIIRTVTDRRRRFPLMGFRASLAKLYPVLSEEPAQISWRVRPAIVVFVVGSIAAVVILAWYLTHIGLTAWR